LTAGNLARYAACSSAALLGRVPSAPESLSYAPSPSIVVAWAGPAAVWARPWARPCVPAAAAAFAAQCLQVRACPYPFSPTPVPQIRACSSYIQSTCKRNRLAHHIGRTAPSSCPFCGQCPFCSDVGIPTGVLHSNIFLGILRNFVRSSRKSELDLGAVAPSPKARS